LTSCVPCCRTRQPGRGRWRVGEIGLDFFVAGADVARQEHFFVEQLKIARDADLPVLLHVRRAVDQVLGKLRRIRLPGGIAHAFNGSRQQADEFIRLGFRLGFGGAMTYLGSTRIRRLAASLPLSAIVLETDAPDMSPAWLAGARNTPAELPRIAAVLAELRGIDPTKWRA
jgi:TatD DNase family protein